MARLAGDTSTYDFKLLDKNTGEVTDYGFELVSVTSVIKQALDTTFSRAAYWGQNLALRVLAEPFGSTPEALKEFLQKNSATPYQKMKEGQKRGNSCHQFLEVLVAGLASITDDGDIVSSEHHLEGRADGYQRAVWAWWKTTQPQVIASERPVWSLKHGYIGTPDLVWRTQPFVAPLGDNEVSGNRVVVLTDLKTHSGDVRDEDILQVTAYALAYEELGLGTIDRLSILLAREDGTFEETYVERNDEAFLAVLEVWKWRKNGRKEASGG